MMRSLLLIVLIIPLNLLAFTVYVIPGHEHITRFAIDSLENDMVASDFYGPLKEGAKLRSHPLILGSVLTDMPFLAKEGEIDLLARVYKDEFQSLSDGDQKDIRDSIKMHTHYNSQHMHFTRNATDPSKEEVVSSYKACMQSRDFIVDGVFWATQTFNGEIHEGFKESTRKYNALTFVGTTLHTIQDSFSHAHTNRDKDSLLTSVCTSLDRYFGQSGEFEYRVFCYHGLLDNELNHGGGSVQASDRVWDRSKAGCSIFQPWKGGFKCLKDEVQLASFVSGRFLNFISPILYEASQGRSFSRSEINDNLIDFFETKELDNGKGYFNCEGLADFYPNTRFEL